MIIAVNTRLNKETQPEGYEDFMFTILHQLTKKNPQHRFLFIFDSPYDEKINFAENVQPVIAGSKTSNSLRLQYWFNYKIPSVLRKHKADVFISMEGICCLRTKIPQCLLISDLRFLQYPQSIKKSQTRFYKKYTAAFLAKAKSIATVSEYSKKLIADHYKIAKEDIAVVHSGIDDIFKPLDWKEKEIIKEKYAGGKAYFLCSGNNNLINLLKAFSFFKKRQKSNMMLLIAGNADAIFKKELSTYKYRDEVRLLENLAKEDYAKIMAAAYALVYPVLYTDLALPPLQAMQCGVAVVTSKTEGLPSICSEAALYSNTEDFKDIAENMMLVFKDENKVTELIEAGNKLIQQYRPGKSADLLMQCILKAINN